MKHFSHLVSALRKHAEQTLSPSMLEQAGLEQWRRVVRCRRCCAAGDRAAMRRRAAAPVVRRREGDSCNLSDQKRRLLEREPAEYDESLPTSRQLIGSHVYANLSNEANIDN